MLLLGTIAGPRAPGAPRVACVIRLPALKLRDLADRLDCRLEGDGGVEIRRVAGIETAEAGDLTFFANPRYGTALRSTQAAAVILADDAPAAPCPMLRTAEPYLAFRPGRRALHGHRPPDARYRSGELRRRRRQAGRRPLRRPLRVDRSRHRRRAADGHPSPRDRRGRGDHRCRLRDSRPGGAARGGGARRPGGGAERGGDRQRRVRLRPPPRRTHQRSPSTARSSSRTTSRSARWWR